MRPGRVEMKKRLQILAVTALVSLASTTPLFWYFESKCNPKQVGSFGDAVWWWIVTSTTLGYGDIVPLSWQARVTAVFTIVVGFFIFANLVAIIAESVHAFVERKSRGKVQIKVRDHIVLCEYTAVADELIQSFQNCPSLSAKKVVIVSDLVSQNPYPQHLFVNGVPINPAILHRANVEYASHVYIFANLRFAAPDVKTLHIASRVVALNPKAKLFLEMIDPQNELLKYGPEGVTVMPSRELIESILRDKKIDLEKWFK